MALLDLFKPKWQHSNPSIRKGAVQKIASTEIDLLTTIFTSDIDSEVRRAALARIDDLTVLLSLRDTPDSPPDLVIELAEKIDKLLIQIILTHTDLEQKRHALSQLTQANSLAKVAVVAEEVELRIGAVEKISEPELLLDILKEKCGRAPGLAAIKKINESAILQEISSAGSSKHIRAAARDKFRLLNGPTEAEINAANRDKFLNLLADIEKLTVLPDPERASKELPDLEKKWQKLPTPVEEELQQQFHKALATINNRLQNFRQHEAKRLAEEESLNSEVNKLSAILQEMEDLIDCPNDVNVSKFDLTSEKFYSNYRELASPPLELANKIGAIKQRFIAARNTFKSEEHILAKLFRDLQAIEKLLANKELSPLPSLLSELRDSIATQSFLVISTREIEEKIAGVEQKFKEVKSVITDSEAKIADIRRGNFEKRLQLIRDIADLNEIADRSAAEAQVKEIKTNWLHHTDLPKDSQNLELAYREALDSFYEHQREFYRDRDWQSWNNRNMQESLIFEMEGLTPEMDLHLVFKKMQALQAKWRKTGSCTPKDAKGLWLRFHEASEAQFKRCQLFFAELDQKAAENLLKKKVLILQARDVQDSSSWQKTSGIFKTLQEEWKGIGRAPKDKEDEAYQEFRAACDMFFNRRSAHYKELADKRLENLCEKEKLCLEIETYLTAPEESHHETIQKIQKGWKEIGAVPKEKENEVWQRFRGLCDQFYVWLDTLKPANLAKKELICQRLDEVVALLDPDFTNIAKVASQVISIQKEWQMIGPAPKEDNNKIWAKFRQSCDTFFDLRKSHFAAIDKQRPENESRKNKIIKQALNLSQEKSRDSVKKIIAYQEEWKVLGPASQKNDYILERKFKEVCNDFFRGRRQHFEELDAIRRENLKKKEELCIRLELIADIEQPKRHGPPGKKNSSMTLAEQLKLAFEENFIMAGDDKSSQRRKKDEIKQIEIDWQKVTGQVPKEHANYIQNRYQHAMKACTALISHEPTRGKRA